MANERRCENCIVKCPQAKMAHEIAKGRMYATNEFIALQKKVENGELVEVVRCKDCKWWNEVGCAIFIVDDSDKPTENDFCSFGERRCE